MSSEHIANGDGGTPPPVPSLLALEAAAMEAVAAMLSGPGKKPSEEAVLIMVRMMANRARRELLAKQSVPDSTQPKL
jgi:hypothetical protein